MGASVVSYGLSAVFARGHQLAEPPEPGPVEAPLERMSRRATSDFARLMVTASPFMKPTKNCPLAVLTRLIESDSSPRVSSISDTMLFFPWNVPFLRLQHRCQNGYFSPWDYRPLFATLDDMEAEALKTLGSRIRERRKSLGWSQEEMAGRAGIDRSYIGGVERGERNISFLTLCQLARTVKCDVASLTRGLP